MASATPESLAALAEDLGLRPPDNNIEMYFYGLSKACVSAYTLVLAKQHPNLKINSCTPG